ncbi:hypothetical protein DFP73DRAFT_51074 [Morchella snyderi]|nr:hypothetical protein DFP73DRAFT_51074 [Morchella snyderi]
MVFTIDYFSIGDSLSTTEGMAHIADTDGHAWFYVMFAANVLIGVFCFQLLYTFKVLVTLASIETPPAISLPLDTDNRKAADILGISDRQQYVTSSIRGTLKHLRTQAGVLSAWRGFGASFVYYLATASVANILHGFLGASLPASLVIVVLSTLLLARFSLAVTHIIISRPQPTWWIKRVLAIPWSSARKTLPAMTHLALAQWATYKLLALASNDESSLPIKVSMALLNFAMNLFVVLPLWIILVRVQASLLPDTQEAIVSFDRTFGKEGSDVLSFKEAAKSFKCKGWQRMAMLVGKMVGIIAGLAVVMALARFMLLSFTM